MSDAQGIGLPSSVIRGNRPVKEALRRQIGIWEGRRVLVNTQMARKGYTAEQIAAALDRCDLMLDFYDEALEKLE